MPRYPKGMDVHTLPGPYHSGRATKAQLEFTANKLLKGAGAGADPTEIDVPTGVTIVRKTDNEIVNNSTVLQNDDHLLFPMVANGIYLAEFILMARTGTFGTGINFGFAYPTGCTMRWGPLGHLVYGTSNYDRGYWLSQFPGGSSSGIYALLTETDTLAAGLKSLNLVTGIILRAIVVNGATAGNLNLQWAQNVAAVEDTLVLANSCLVVTRLS